MSSKLPVTLSDVLRLRGLSRAELANRSRISAKTMDRWMLKQSRRQLSKVSKVATVLDKKGEELQQMLDEEVAARKENEQLRLLRTSIAVLDDICHRPDLVAGKTKRAKKRLLVIIELAESALRTIGRPVDQA